MKRTYSKREIITDTSFEFTKDKLLYRIQYQVNGKAPDKRFDKSSGLCLFLYPTGMKTFYAVKLLSMYNKNKNRTEKNAVYKKIFRMEDMERMKELEKYQEDRNRERNKKYGLKPIDER